MVCGELKGLWFVACRRDLVWFMASWRGYGLWWIGAVMVVAGGKDYSLWQAGGLYREVQFCKEANLNVTDGKS